MHGAEPGREARKLFPIEPHFDELTSDTGPHPPPPQVERERWWPPDERLERDGLRNRSRAVYSHQRTLSRQKCPCGMVTWVCLNSSDEFRFDHVRVPPMVPRRVVLEPVKRAVERRSDLTRLRHLKYPREAILQVPEDVQQVIDRTEDQGPSVDGV